MKISGNSKVKTTAEGLRVIDLKLARATANMAMNWLYGLLVFDDMVNYSECSGVFDFG